MKAEEFSAASDVTHDADDAVLRLRGPLTVANAEAWRMQWAEQFARGVVADVDLAGLTQMDVFGLQLLYAACRTAESRGRTLRLLNPAESFLISCTAAGFEPTDFAPRAQQLS